MSKTEQRKTKAKLLCLHSSVLTALLVSLIEWRLVWTHSCRISVFVRSFAFVDVWVYIFSPTKATKGATTGGHLVVESLMCPGLYPFSSSLFLHSWLFLLSSSILSTASLSPSSTLTLSEWPEWPAPSHMCFPAQPVTLNTHINECGLQAGTQNVQIHKLYPSNLHINTLPTQRPMSCSSCQPLTSQNLLSYGNLQWKTSILLWTQCPLFLSHTLCTPTHPSPASRR